MTSTSNLKKGIFPLEGLNILVTRQETKGSNLSEMLVSRGAKVFKEPMSIILPPVSWKMFDHTAQHSAMIDWAVFTSSNGIRYCFSRLKELGLNSRKIFSNLRIACIGKSTASTLAENGRIPELVPKYYQSEGLAEAFNQYDLFNKTFWLIQAESARKFLSNALAKNGAQIITTPVYRNVPTEVNQKSLLSSLKSQKIDWIIFTSPSAIQNFQHLLPLEFWLSLSKVPKIACLGEITSATAESFGLKVDAKPEIQNFEKLVQKLCDINS